MASWIRARRNRNGCYFLAWAIDIGVPRAKVARISCPTLSKRRSEKHEGNEMCMSVDDNKNDPGPLSNNQAPALS